MATEFHYVLVVYMFINKVKFSSLCQCNIYIYMWIPIVLVCIFISVYFEFTSKFLCQIFCRFNFPPAEELDNRPEVSDFWDIQGHGDACASAMVRCSNDWGWKSQEKWWFHVELTRLNGIDLCCCVVPCFPYSVRHGHLQKIEKTHRNRFKTGSQCQVVPR
jgi:hypothetical protein